MSTPLLIKSGVTGKPGQILVGNAFKLPAKTGKYWVGIDSGLTKRLELTDGYKNIVLDCIPYIQIGLLEGETTISGVGCSINVFSLPLSLTNL